MALEISGGEDLPSQTRKSLEELTDRILEEFGRPDEDVSLRLTDSKEIRKLNRRFRGLDKPTNVLAFTLDEEEDGFLGEVILCLEKAKEEAGQARMSFPERLHELLAHGLLHLLGFDHESDREHGWENSERRVRGILRRCIRENSGCKDSRS